MENKKFGLDSVVGKISENRRGKIFENVKNSFNEGYLSSEMSLNLLQFEIKKDEKLLKDIAEANELTSNYRKNFREDIFDIPEKNIHFLDSKNLGVNKTGSKSNSQAYFNTFEQSIFLQKTDSEIDDFGSLVHEMNHFKSHNKLFIGKEKYLGLFSKEIKGVYRGGLSLLETESKQLLFSNLNESVTEKIANKILWEKTKLSLTKAELSMINTITRENGVRPENVFNMDIEKFRKGEVFLSQTSYFKQIKFYVKLVEKISQRLQKTEKEVEYEFEKAYFTGNLNKLAHLVNEALGDYAFSVLAKLDYKLGDLEQLELFINSN
ncbi:MAG: hypothetical protein NTZ44_04205 [Candidatus Nomurabacteria bacterium]|nr:hypothetical protein [Candidatus Nomurabacteria bacterium]